MYIILYVIISEVKARWLFLLVSFSFALFYADNFFQSVIVKNCMALHFNLRIKRLIKYFSVISYYTYYNAACFFLIWAT